MALLLEMVQTGIQPFAAILAATEGLDGTQLRRLVQTQAQHFRSGLLDMRVEHPATAFRQPAEEDEQQFLVG
ncbi:hypothetical protein D9M68_818960 [compost metagenome]